MDRKLEEIQKRIRQTGGDRIIVLLVNVHAFVVE